jgi:hypothetical protein
MHVSLLPRVLHVVPTPSSVILTSNPHEVKGKNYEAPHFFPTTSGYFLCSRMSTQFLNTIYLQWSKKSCNPNADTGLFVTKNQLWLQQELKMTTHPGEAWADSDVTRQTTATGQQSTCLNVQPSAHWLLKIPEVKVRWWQTQRLPPLCSLYLQFPQEKLTAPAMLKAYVDYSSFEEMGPTTQTQYSNFFDNHYSCSWKTWLFSALCISCFGY